ncbi:Ferredoxin II [Candidatus Hodgkinia cicadicola]|nr:Ferredoxin II [Candidatus Hodgkinia cicadicola]
MCLFLFVFVFRRCWCVLCVCSFCAFGLVLDFSVVLVVRVCVNKGRSFLAINPNERTRRGVCGPRCPAGVTKSAAEPNLEEWVQINSKYSRIWPNVARWTLSLPKADELNGTQLKCQKGGKKIKHNTRTKPKPF